MPSRKSHKSEIRSTLQAAGIYNERNERLITETARCLDLIDRMAKELPKGSLMLTQTGSCSQEKVAIHPYMSMICKYEAIVGRNLVALGLGNVQSGGKMDDDVLKNLIDELK